MSTDINIPNQEDCFEILNARHKSWRRRGKKNKKNKTTSMIVHQNQTCATCWEEEYHEELNDTMEANF
jgi:hypothetical protein